ncbi:MAG: PAS domain-containing protein [bacterium]|nr:PAS domain-containing protein [bacterium]
MITNCLYCQKPLNFWCRLARKLYCSREHHEAYLETHSELATAELARRGQAAGEAPGSLADLMASLECDRHFFQEVLDQTPVGVAVVSEGLIIEYANQAIRVMLGQDLDDSSTIRMKDLDAGEDLAPIAETVFDTEEPRTNLLLTNPVTSRALRITVQPLGFWEEGRQRRTLVMVDDVTEILESVKSREPDPVGEPSAAMGTPYQTEAGELSVVYS